MIFIVFQKMLNHNIVMLAQNLNKCYSRLLDLLCELFVGLAQLLQPKSLDIPSVATRLPEHTT